MAIIALCVSTFSQRNSADIIDQISLGSMVETLEGESEAIAERHADLSFENESGYGNSLKSKRWYVTKYDNGKEVYWNSNKLKLDSAILNQHIYPVHIKYGDDVYLLFRPDVQLYTAFRISNDGDFHSRIKEAIPESNDAFLDTDSLSTIHADGPLPTKAKINSSSPNLVYLFIGSFALLLLQLAFFFVEKNKLFGIITGFLLIGVNLLTIYILQLSIDSFIFNSNHLFQELKEGQSLLLLFNHLIVASSLLLVIFFITKKAHWALMILPMTMLYFMSDLVLDLGRQIVLNSNISFDFEKLFGLSWHTFITIAFLGLCFFALWAILRLIKRHIDSNRLFAIVFAVSAILFVVFQFIDASRTLSSLLIPITIIVFGSVILVYFNKPKRKNLGLFILSLVAISVLIHSSRQAREDLSVKELANELITNSDPQAESRLLAIENKLAQEFLVPEDYKNFLSKKEVVENRLKRLYFSKYLEKYELKLLSFDPEGENVNQNNIYSFEDLDNIYNSSDRTTSSYFLQITSSTGFSGYIAKYENCDLEGHNGTTFILLQPRVVQSEFLYPEVFANQQDQRVVNLDDYSFGIYYDQKLISQRGGFPYQLNKIPNENDNTWINGYSHQRFENQGYEVVLTHKSTGLSTWLSSFTFTLLLLLPLTLFLALLAYWIFGKENNFSTTFLPLNNKYISSRIQSSLTLILLVGLLLSVYIIINYIRSNYNENLENQLLSTVKNMSSQFQNKVDLEKKLANEEDRLLMLNEESSTYKVDINLFDKAGKMLGTTKPYLIENEIVGDLMSPNAFQKLTLARNSQLLIQEELEGSKYLSAYVPLFNGKNEVIGFLNTPYFAKNEELNKQISSLVVNIINIYFLLLFGVIALAYILSKRIAKPLLLIQEKMSTTDLGHQNELISYDREDEIGQLVRQYNKMVLQLEDSADQLAESEREGAWREMAKQVAHEIKNPLTPMKLSIQHLQRAYESGGGAKLDELFEKTSKLLVEQIESLSNMASEFSNFAKMPEDKYEHFDVSDCLEKTVHLFEQSENTSFSKEIDSNAIIDADPEQISRVFSNLIKNGIQAIPEGRKGQLKIKLSKIEGITEIVISDNGKGILESNKKRVFVPNFSTKTSGMGLGLAISKKIIETAGGSISFVTESDKGTTFTIKLPLVENT